MTLKGRPLFDVQLSILPARYSDVILGQEFQRKARQCYVEVVEGGDLPPLVMCGLTTLSVEPPGLFVNLTADSHPVAARSRRYSHEE